MTSGKEKDRSQGVPGKPVARVQSKDRDMGSALRSIYQKTIDEKVPDDLMALLGKLD